MINSNSHESTPLSRDVVIVGKIYANWCSHCQSLIPEWNNMKILMDKYVKNKQIKFEEIEQADENVKLPLINNTYLNGSPNKVALQSGYPTIFSIKNNDVEYYNGERNADSMYKWFITKINVSTPETKEIPKNNTMISLKSSKKRKNSSKTQRKRKLSKNKFMSKSNMKKSIKRRLMNMKKM